MSKTHSSQRLTLAQARPDLLHQWHPTRNAGLDATTLLLKSNKKVWWVCEHGHEWEAPVSARTSGSGCPVCTGRKVLVGFNDFASGCPDLVPEWHPTKNGDLTPQDVTRRAGKVVWWECGEGHEWQAPVARRSGGAGCPVCKGKTRAVGFNDLATTHPELAAQWHPTKNTLTPQQVGRGSMQKVWWQCPVRSDHEWEAMVYSRVAGSGCPYCSNRRTLPGFNDINTTHPELAAQWHPTKNEGISARDLTRSSAHKVWWQCAKGHEWQSPVYARKLDGQGCPECYARTFVSKGEKEILAILLTLDPDLVVETSTRSPLAGAQGNFGSGELDIYLPEKKLAVEFNGVYWHSEVFKNRDYHAAKARACAERGITLYQVWEDDWRDKREIVIRGLAHRLSLTDRLPKVLPALPLIYSQKIGARSCSIAKVHRSLAKEFLAKNHIQGFASGGLYLGLQDREGILRALLVVKKDGSSQGLYRIERYATAGTVSGGFTRLIKHAETLLSDLETWVTFADLAVSEGDLYMQSGFSNDGMIPADYSYLVNATRTHKFNYRLKRFKTDPDLVWQEGLSESELAKLNGLLRVWDSGKIRWVKRVR